MKESTAADSNEIRITHTISIATSYEIETTLDEIPVHCECAVEDGQLTLENVLVKVVCVFDPNGTMAQRNSYTFKTFNLIDILKPSSIALLQTKCQELCEEEQLS